VDTLGLIIVLVVHTAAIVDRRGAELVLASKSVPARLKHIWADQGYGGPIVERAARERNINVEVVGNPSKHEFQVAAKRWVVERTNAWISSARRLTKDHEKTVASAESMIYLRAACFYAKWKHNGKIG
jgi:transposase